MRLSRFVLLSLGTAAMVACGGADVTTPAVPPLASVRFINALSDTGFVDVRAIDQVAYSPVANNLAFRAATVYQNAAVGVRHYRVFPTSTNINVTSQVMADVSVTFPVDAKITLVVAGSARAGTVRLWVINDATTPPASGQIGVRMVNAATGQVNGYITTAPADALPGSPTFSNVLALAPSAYVNMASGATALQVTDAGSSTVNAAAAGPPAPASLPGENPAAGVTSAGTMFSAYYFPASVCSTANCITGSTAPQTPAFLVPAIIWFVDRNPCDVPAVAGCTP
jgi:Domain of unknown function (DUF4397)